MVGIYMITSLAKNTILNTCNVETTRDECSGVGQRMSYCPKCMAILYWIEEIVHSCKMVNYRAK